jgi:hypothetical protein
MEKNYLKWINLNAGRKAFALGMFYLGCVSIIAQDFILGRPPYINTDPALSFLLSISLFAASVLIFLNNKRAGVAAFSIGLIILVFSFLVRVVPTITTWEGALWSINAYKALALVGGSFIIAVSFFDEGISELPRFLKRFISTKYLKFIGIALLALFLVISGCSHFKYFENVLSYMPAYIPFHNFFVKFTGLCLVAGGIGLLIPYTRSWSALLSSTMIFAWFILLHIPRLFTHFYDPNDRMGFGESFVFAGVLWVLFQIEKNRSN